jgi:uncharacterized protein
MSATVSAIEFKEEENISFRDFLSAQSSSEIDAMVFALNKKHEALIDCTTCGNCCRSLMINLEAGDSERLSSHLQMTNVNFKTTYVECSSSGEIEIMNTIPCHFLSENKCTVYEARPSECREFPGLHRENFIGRSFATFMHYDRCPIIHDVIEDLKIETGFTNKEY